jgi:hypothetical protein
MKEVLIESLLSIIKREDIKKELKNFMKPFIEMILIELYPYVYASMIFVIISFILHLGIFILLFSSSQKVI